MYRKQTISSSALLRATALSLALTTGIFSAAYAEHEADAPPAPKAKSAQTEVLNTDTAKKAADEDAAAAQDDAAKANAPAPTTTSATDAKPAEGTTPAPADNTKKPSDADKPADAVQKPADATKSNAKPGDDEGSAAPAPTPAADAKPAGGAGAAPAPAPANTGPAVANTPTPAPAPSPAPAQSADMGKAAEPSSAESNEPEKPKRNFWPFAGITGHLDKQAAQRGFQVYKQVCSACHSMNLVSYRSLTQLGFSEGEVKSIAAEKQVPDVDDKGETIQRPGKPFDHFVPPYPNEDASRAANGGAYPPDLSLIIKAREQGPDYVFSILTGFGTPPAGVTPVANKYYNPYFANHWISMPPPLNQGVLDYQDGTQATIDQMARDVVVFLQWAAEPETEDRHEMGVKVLIFLVLMTGFLYAAKRQIWSKIKH